MPPTPEQIVAEFAPEIKILTTMLQPGLGPPRLEAAFVALGFCADANYDQLLIDQIPERLRADHLKDKSALNVVLGDILQPYVDRLPLNLPGWPTERVSYLYSLGTILNREKSGTQMSLANDRWERFSREVNQLPTANVDSPTRGELAHASLIDAAHKRYFKPSLISLQKVKAWHPRPSWLDSAIILEEHSTFQIIATCETPRPLKHRPYSNETREPEWDGTMFDTIEPEVWVVPRGSTKNFIAVFRINCPFLVSYNHFFTVTGFRHCIDARVSATSLMLGK
jgi:hypothetical protein